MRKSVYEFQTSGGMELVDRQRFRRKSVKNAVTIAPSFFDIERHSMDDQTQDYEDLLQNLILIIILKRLLNDIPLTAGWDIFPFQAPRLNFQLKRSLTQGPDRYNHFLCRPNWPLS